ncbi:unnamed protein product [Trichogramma brassicae]|uniref:Uncharacterized protein n=1 Tax=Trichogramma brassicae TaxID=86971 RepID=A0A6H5I8T0_9HYME|nr:unnamed protein product [Trichogramma brassicae]
MFSNVQKETTAVSLKDHSDPEDEAVSTERQETVAPSKSKSPVRKENLDHGGRKLRDRSLIKAPMRFQTNVAEVHVPSTYAEATTGSNASLWTQAIKEELDAHKENETWTFVPRNPAKTTNQVEICPRLPLILCLMSKSCQSRNLTNSSNIENTSLSDLTESFSCAVFARFATCCRPSRADASASPRSRSAAICASRATRSATRGLLGTEDNDACCDKNCKLRRNQGAVCSDKNSPCCQNCAFMGAGGQVSRRAVRHLRAGVQVHRRLQRVPALAGHEGRHELPRARTVPSGQMRALLRNSGSHQLHVRHEYVDCYDYMFLHRFKFDDSRLLLLQPETRANAAVVWGSTILASRSIRRTYCPMELPAFKAFVTRAPAKKKTIQDVVERFWDIIEDININKVMRFLKDNIVGAVIISTAIVWIPTSCVISYIDKRQLKRYREEVPLEKYRSTHTSRGAEAHYILG